MKNAKSEDFLEGNCKVAWDRFVSKYALHTVSYLLKLKSEFHNSKLESVDKDPNEWISHLEGLRIHMNEFGQKCNVSDEDFVIHILNHLPKEYDVILDGLENRLTVTGDDALTIDSIREKFNHRYEKSRVKKKKKLKKKKHWVLMISNISSSARNVESLATNLVIGDALKIKMKKMKIIRKQKDMNVKIKI